MFAAFPEKADVVVSMKLLIYMREAVCEQVTQVRTSHENRSKLAFQKINICQQGLFLNDE